MEFEGFKIKQKGWIWKLTYPFAHSNYTVIGSTIFCPNDKLPPAYILKHEKIHVLQRQKYGAFLFYFLYLFALPFVWNPFRYKWEMEAYIKGSKLNEKEAKKLLQSPMYGWLQNE